MYASHGFLRSDIGDVDVIRHDGLYHLFHLVLPNHDFIAHAVSRDGMTWRRVQNALFVDDPGAWDDDMLWTMHVSPDPDRDGAWRMFYTGLCRHEYGRVQRIGLARSTDLYNWTRSEVGYPLQISNHWYESRADEGRKWVSFRDPFFYRDPDTGERLLLAAGRVNHGPIIRRGCVSVARETAPDEFTFEAPLYHPGLYDDVEVPNLLRLDGRHYLIGSMREDVKIHYWYADALRGPYMNFADNVLLPKGNYAARICRAGDRYLLFNFFQHTEIHYGRETVARMLPPPKELVTDRRGRLMLRSFRGFDDLADDAAQITDPGELEPLSGNAHAETAGRDGALHIGCTSGFEAFLLSGMFDDFRLRARITLQGPGKCGLIFRTGPEGDGYYLALDLVKGYAQLRGWGANPHPEFEHAFRYQPLQSGAFPALFGKSDIDIEVITHGMYIEMSINDQVTLSLVDDSYGEGRTGFYTESAELRLEDVRIERLRRPVAEEEPVYTATRQQPDMPHSLAEPLPTMTGPAG